MVEKALRSVGKSVGDLAPGQFFQFGDVVSSPAPGDLVITGGHVAIYVGNGQVISGGLNGMNTGLHFLSDLPGASFVRVR
jgi:cell wall-associated NlpC family hydrolase